MSLPLPGVSSSQPGLGGAQAPGSVFDTAGSGVQGGGIASAQISSSPTPDLGSSGLWDMAHVSAVAVGAGIAAWKLPAVTIPMREAALSKLNARPAVSRPAAPERPMPATAERPMPAAGQEPMTREQLSGPQGRTAAMADTEAKTAGNAARASRVAEKSGAIARTLGGKIAQSESLAAKGLTQGGRLVGKLATSSAGRVAARLGTKMGLRLAAFAIPGPGWAVGAVVLAGTWLLDPELRGIVKKFVGGLFGSETPALDAPPSPPDTNFLPLTHDGNRDGIIRAKDQTLTELNSAMFAIDPDKVWHPVDPPVPTTSGFEATVTGMTDLIARASEIAVSVDALMKKYESEPLVQRARQGVRPSLDALSAVGEQVVVPVGNAVSSLATETNTAYQSLRTANVDARQAISDSANGIVPWDFSVDESKMGSVDGVADRYYQAASQAFTSIDQAVGGWSIPSALTPAVAPSSMHVPSTTESHAPSPSVGPTVQGTVPMSTTPAVPSTPSVASGSATKTPNSLADVLAQLSRSQNPSGVGTGQSPMPSSPLGNNPLGGMPQSNSGMGSNPMGGMGSPFGNQAPSAANAGKGLDDLLRNALQSKPATENKKKSTTESNDKDDEAKKDDKKPEAKAAGAADPAPMPATDPAKPATDGKPATAGAPADPAPAPGKPSNPLEPAAPKPEPASKVVGIDGKEVTFSDTRTAKMVTALNPADGAPPTIEKAAGDAGFKIPPPGQDIGERQNPASMRPGDLVIGADDHRGVYLGDGKVLSDGEVKPLGDIAHFTGRHEGIFRIDSETAPAPEPAPASADPNAQPAPAAPQPNAAAVAATDDAPAAVPTPAAEAAPVDGSPIAPAPAADTSGQQVGDAPANPLLPQTGQPNPASPTSGSQPSRVPTSD